MLESVAAVVPLLRLYRVIHETPVSTMSVGQGLSWGNGYGYSHADRMSWGWGHNWPVSRDPDCGLALSVSARLGMGSGDWEKPTKPQRPNYA